MYMDKTFKQFDKLFKENCKKGLIQFLYLLKLNTIPCVMRIIIKSIDQLLINNNIIGDRLNRLSELCYYLFKQLGIFKQNNDHVKSMKTLQYIGNNHNMTILSLYNIFQNDSMSVMSINQIIKQIIIDIYIKGSNNCLFTFSNMNITDNITMCDYNLVNLFILNKKTYICIPTLGYRLFDKNMNLLYSKKDNYEKIYKIIKFLSYSNKDKKINNILKKISNNMHLFDTIRQKNSRYINNMLCRDIKNTNSLLFTHTYKCIKLFSNVLTYPLRKRKYNKIRYYYNIFYNEFSKIEENIIEGDDILKIKEAFLRDIIHAAYIVHDEYIIGKQNNIIKALNIFNKYIQNKIGISLKKFEIDLEILICSIYSFVENLEGLLFNLSIPHQYLYNNQINHFLNIYKILCNNTGNKYIFSTKTKIKVINTISKREYILKKSIPLNIINDLNNKQHNWNYIFHDLLIKDNA